MKDLIDLGNLTLNRLIEAHDEIEESRLLFLYGVTTSARWQVAGSAKWVLIEPSGLSKNFEDLVLDSLNEQWLTVSRKSLEDRTQKRLDALRSEFDMPSPKPGDIFEFGKSSGEFREIRWLG